MDRPVFLLQMVEATRIRTVIEVYKQGVGRMEFRSNAIWQWGMGFENQDGSTDHILNHGKNLSWAEWLHNGLEGWHTCIFYTGDQFCIHENHSDYEFVAKLFDLGMLPDREVMKLTGGLI